MLLTPESHRASGLVPVPRKHKVIISHVSFDVKLICQGSYMRKVQILSIIHALTVGNEILPQKLKMSERESNGWWHVVSCNWKVLVLSLSSFLSLILPLSCLYSFFVFTLSFFILIFLCSSVLLSLRVHSQHVHRSSLIYLPPPLYSHIYLLHFIFMCRSDGSPPLAPHSFLCNQSLMSGNMCWICATFLPRYILTPPSSPGVFYVLT